MSAEEVDDGRQEHQLLECDFSLPGISYPLVPGIRSPSPNDIDSLLHSMLFSFLEILIHFGKPFSLTG